MLNTKEIKTLDLPRKQEVRNIIADICSFNNHDVSQAYYKSLPALCTENHPLLDPGIIYRQLKDSHIQAQTLMNMIKISSSETLRFNPNAIRALYSETLPRLLTISSINKRANNIESFNLGLYRLAEAVRDGKLYVVSPLCPPYTYEMENGNLVHASGELQPTIGKRFAHSAEAVATTFAPLAKAGVDVNVIFLTYSGETGRLEDLTDLGADVIEYYKSNPNEIFSRLQNAFSELRQQTTEIMSRYSINSSVSSIESTLAPKINELTADFASKFYDVKFRMESFIPKDSQVDEWLKSHLDVDKWWLVSFVKEEINYRSKQGKLLEQKSEDSIPVAALREGLLYLALTQFARKSNNTLFLDLETTDNYMKQSLRFYEAPVIMGGEFNPDEPYNTASIRQPFNLPSQIL